MSGLARPFARSCLLSLVAVLAVVLLLGRLVRLGPLPTAAVALAVWAVVILFLVRLRRP